MWRKAELACSYPPTNSRSYSQQKAVTEALSSSSTSWGILPVQIFPSLSGTSARATKHLTQPSVTSDGGAHGSKTLAAPLHLAGLQYIADLGGQIISDSSSVGAFGARITTQTTRSSEWDRPESRGFQTPPSSRSDEERTRQGACSDKCRRAPTAARNEAASLRHESGGCRWKT